MHERQLAEAQRLSDHELTARLTALAGRERAATVALIAHLAVFDARQLYLAEGFTSLFMYCTEILHLSEYAAYHRIEAARTTREFPAILDMLAEGALTLATVRVVAPLLTPENHERLLAAARDKSKREVEEFVADLRPRPAAATSIRIQPLSGRAASSESVTDSGRIGSALGRPLSPEQPPGEDHDGRNDSSTAWAIAAPPIDSQVGSVACARSSANHQLVIEPLGERRYRVQFTAAAETCDKLRLAQDLLRHQMPDGDVAPIIDRALTLLVESLARRKFAATERPRDRTSVAPADDGANGLARGSRHIPAEVKRGVWLRDGGRCAFIAHSGRRCNARGFLEFHHKKPYAAGGEATVENVELRCRAHNRYEAGLYFGPEQQNVGATGRAAVSAAALRGPTATTPAAHDLARAGPG